MCLYLFTLILWNFKNNSSNLGVKMSSSACFYSGRHFITDWIFLISHVSRNLSFSWVTWSESTQVVLTLLMSLCVSGISYSRANTGLVSMYNACCTSLVTWVHLQNHWKKRPNTQSWSLTSLYICFGLEIQIIIDACVACTRLFPKRHTWWGVASILVCRPGWSQTHTSLLLLLSAGFGILIVSFCMSCSLCTENKLVSLL